MNRKYFDFLDSIKRIIDRYDSSVEYDDIRKSLRDLRLRLEDSTLNLGVVGAFSSGKSTFINSLIQKNLLPTDAVQGTTVTATILRKADKNDLEIHYLNDKILRFSQNGDELAQIYGLEASQMFELFLEVISNEEKAKDIEKVILNLKNENIFDNIGIVDTPGIESLNARHNEITQNAIEKICDALIIVIPYDEPVSEELLAYINTNIKELISNCIFVVTKVELLEDMEELPRLISVIKRRLENGLSIKNPIVLPMPTLLYLKSVDSETNIILLDDIETEVKSYLSKLYKNNLGELCRILNSNKDKYICSKMTVVCEHISKNLIENLKIRLHQYEEENAKLLEHQVMSLEEFEKSVKKEIYHQKKYIFDILEKGTTDVINGYSKMENRITKQILKESDLESLHKTIEKSISHTAAEEVVGCILKRLDAVKIEEKEICSRIAFRFEEEYGRCGKIRKDIKVDTRFDLSIVTDFVENKTESFYETQMKLCGYIRQQTSGFTQMIKSLFTDNVQEEKESVIRYLTSYLETEKSEAKEFVEDWNKKVAFQAIKYILKYLEKLIKENSLVICKYVEDNMFTIKGEGLEQAQLEKDIAEILSLKKQLKES